MTPTDAEKRVRKAFLAGDREDFRVGDPAEDDPTHGAAWGPERTVRAAFIRDLLYEENGPRCHLVVTGVRVSGKLNLAHMELQRRRLGFADCWFDDGVMLYGTKLRRLSFRGSVLPWLTAASTAIDGNLLLNDARVGGQIRIDAARIAGGVLIDRAVLTNPGATALRAGRVQVDSYFLMRDTVVEGTVVLRDARIDGELNLGRTRLATPGGIALDAARVQVGSDFLADELQAEGYVGVPGSKSAGLLRLAGAKLRNPGGVALDAYQAKIGADFQCYEGFEAEGDVRVTGAQVSGHLRFDGAELRAESESALDARYVEIGGAARCRDLHAVGPVRFASAKVANDLDFRNAMLEPLPTAQQLTKFPTAKQNTAILTLGNLKAGELTLRFREAPQDRIHLSNAQVGVLNDDPATWSPQLNLDGFTYDRLANPGTVAQRVDWLSRDTGGYQPGPYERLADVYRRGGQDGEARRVLLAKQRARRRTLPFAARPWGFVQDAAVGYGYRPERALGWLAALLITGTIVFGLHHPIPSGTDKTPPFNPLIYSLDLLLPVINFGQGKAYVAEGGYQWVAYLLTAAGWILATTIAAGVARAVNRV